MFRDKEGFPVVVMIIIIETGKSEPIISLLKTLPMTFHQAQSKSRLFTLTYKALHDLALSDTP